MCARRRTFNLDRAMGNRLIIVLLSFRYIGLLNGYGCVAFRSPAFYGSYVEGNGVQAHRESEFLGCTFLENTGRQVHCLFHRGFGVGSGTCLVHHVVCDFTCTSPAAAVPVALLTGSRNRYSLAGE